MRIVKDFDLRPVDFDSGKRLALPVDQCIPCDCCGKKISRGSVTSTGHRVGSECTTSIESMASNYYGPYNALSIPAEYGSKEKFLRITPKQFQFFKTYSK